jgi:hypothetical protein
LIARSNGPPDGKTGAPGEGLCTECHGTNQGDGNLTVSGIPVSYEPGLPYLLTVELSDPGQSRWGFEITAIDASGNGAGQFSINDVINTQLSDNAEPGRDYMKHTNTGTYNGVGDGPVYWAFEWTAPSAETGEVDFYAAGNAANGNGNNAGDFIYTFMGTSTPPLGACCLSDGSCLDNIPQADCEEPSGLAGVWRGDGSVCLDDNNGNLIDDACEAIYPAGACCLSGGLTCITTTEQACANADGDYQGDDTQCLGDADPQNGIDDACESAISPKAWIQLPDLEPTGMDVYASNQIIIPPTVLADDFECTQTGPITKIVIWGSFYRDNHSYQHCYPRFMVSIHEDIPAVPGQTHSRPGQLRWSKLFGPTGYGCEVYASGLNEGFYMPCFDHHYEPNADFTCYMYTFTINSDHFIQEGTPENPVVYWIDVQAEVLYLGGTPDLYFGWKTSVNHWNDDATWAIGSDEPGGDPLVWEELRYPNEHPYAGESIDMAFAIFGSSACDCEPGECDGTPPIDILDIVHLIDYKFKECPPGAGLGTCPPPSPYAVCSGDADCNCIVDILDIVHMIDFKFKECPPGAGFGTCPPPCSCEEWVSECGLPIQ